MSQRLSRGSFSLPYCAEGQKKGTIGPRNTLGPKVPSRPLVVATFCWEEENTESPWVIRYKATQEQSFQKESHFSSACRRQGTEGLEGRVGSLGRRKWVRTQRGSHRGRRKERPEQSQLGLLYRVKEEIGVGGRPS